MGEISLALPCDLCRRDSCTDPSGQCICPSLNSVLWGLVPTSTIQGLAFSRTNIHQLIRHFGFLYIWLLWIMLPRTFMYKFLCRSPFVFLLGIYLVELPDHMVKLMSSILSRLASPSQTIIRLTTCDQYHRLELWENQGGVMNIVKSQGPQLRA